VLSRRRKESYYEGIKSSLKLLPISILGGLQGTVADSKAYTQCTLGLYLETGRIFRIEANTVNSGSGYRQWNKGAQMARGDYLWMAETNGETIAHVLGRLAVL